MGKKRYFRIGIGLQEHQLERLRDISAQVQRSQNAMFQAFVSVCSVDEVKNVLSRYDKLLEMEAQLRQTADKNLLNYIRGRSLDEMRTMLDAMKKVATT